MKKTMHIDPALLKAARRAVGADTDTDTVRLALEGLIRHAAYQRAAQLMGSEPDAVEVEAERVERKASSLRARQPPLMPRRVARKKRGTAA